MRKKFYEKARLRPDLSEDNISSSAFSIKVKQTKKRISFSKELYAISYIP